MSKTIVVYYSAQGHVKKIASKIAELKGADLFEIQPAAAYTEDDLNYMSDDSRVTSEFKNPALRDVELVTSEVPGWADYDTVILCYPVWYGMASWVVSSFVSKVDWTGKSVYACCVSHSSPIGSSAQLLVNAANAGEWQDAVRFYQDASDEELEDWAK